MRALKGALALFMAFSTPALAQPDTERLNYSITHQLWGDIGKLTAVISQEDGATRVTTTIDVRVTVLGITLHDTHGQWKEIWRSGELQQFEATTISNGKAERIYGRRNENNFEIYAGAKRMAAPFNIQPVNPWSVQFVHASMLMSPESGRIFPVKFDDKGITAVNGASWKAPLHHYLLHAEGDHDLYFDPTGRLIQFEVSDPTGKAVIALQNAQASFLTAKN